MSVRAVGHLLVAAHFWYGCYYDWNYVKIPLEVADLGDSVFKTKKLKFLTYWDAILQSVFFTICLLNDLFGTNELTPKKKPFIRKLKDIMLPSLTLPLSMFVCLSFWGLYAIDRELIFPKIIDKFFPTWLNHLMHTNIVVFSLLEMSTSYRAYPTRKVGLSILTVFLLSYLFWIHYIHSYTSKWVYPVLNIMNAPARAIFFVICFAVAVLLYLLGEKINGLIWDGRLKNARAKRQQKKQ